MRKRERERERERGSVRERGIVCAWERVVVEERERERESEKEREIERGRGIVYERERNRERQRAAKVGWKIKPCHIINYLLGKSTIGNVCICIPLQDELEQI